ncbi:hypothetical protein L3X38_007837 [Prunus dulcis]|uniref:Uncharacterized protein n=1 Tax=Prunus dulcis TaxID=3755 RepID=A0AAD4ZVJ2_PRUDU|nr:hypothetical protein L3X38_007837 [Prunus dulcis]
MKVFLLKFSDKNQKAEEFELIFSRSLCIKGEFYSFEIHHGGVVQDEVYKGGTLCYLDNCVDDYLSLLDLRKIGIALGYEVDLTKKEIGLQIYCKMYDSNGETIVKFIDNDSVICEMVGCITSNRVLVLYYTNKKTSEKTWAQTSAEWPSLQSEEYNYGRFSEDHMKEVNEALDTDEHIVSLEDCEAAVDEEEEE